MLFKAKSVAYFLAYSELSRYHSCSCTLVGRRWLGYTVQVIVEYNMRAVVFSCYCWPLCGLSVVSLVFDVLSSSSQTVVGRAQLNQMATLFCYLSVLLLN